MQQEFMSNFNQYGKAVVNSAKELTTINSRLASKFLENQLSLAKIFVEGTEKQLAVFEAVESPADLANKEAALIEDMAGKISDANQTSVKIAQEANAELKNWFESGIQVADKAIKNAKDTTTNKVDTVSPVTQSKPVAKKATAVKKASAKKAPAKASASKKTATPKKATAAKSTTVKTPVTKKAAAPDKKTVTEK